MIFAKKFQNGAQSKIGMIFGKQFQNGVQSFDPKSGPKTGHNIAPKLDTILPQKPAQVLLFKIDAYSILESWVLTQKVAPILPKNWTK